MWGGGGVRGARSSIWVGGVEFDIGVSGEGWREGDSEIWRTRSSRMIKYWLKTVILHQRCAQSGADAEAERSHARHANTAWGRVGQ